jgi:hypothetical protein
MYQAKEPMTQSLRITLSACCIVTVSLMSVSCSRNQQVADPNFDTKVVGPAYVNEHPKVLFDEAHRNIHTMRGGYEPFVHLISNDGYSVTANKTAFSDKTLTGIGVLVVVNALGPNNAMVDHSAFTDTECDAVRDWVQAGGSLLLITDHAPTGAAASSLAQRFGVSMSKGMAEDPMNYDMTTSDMSQLVFSRDNGLLLNHPVTQGRDAKETIIRVITFTGQSLKGPESAAPFLRMGDSAVNRPATVRVEKAHGDTRVIITYGDPESAKGYAQGLAMQFGKGRAVILGEAGMLTAQLDGKTQKPFGMNVQGVDNRQLALNIIHWLSRLF